ncbi:hypothetical protein KAT63_03125 [Candidatus Parcubacteria bacterium]|nr:hypothetical protein [Candidatus Parcubacteria bacterium]
MKNDKETLFDIRKELSLEKIYLKHKILPEDRDIDIVISKLDFHKINFPKNYKIVRKKLFFNNHIFVIRLDKKTGALNLLDFHIDGLEYCGVFKIAFNKIENNSVSFLNQNIYVLNNNYCYLDRYLGFMFFKSKKERIIRYLNNNDIPTDFLSDKLQLSIKKVKNPIIIKKALIRKNIKKFILYKIFGNFPPGKKVKVVFIGVDGSGKSSAIVELKKKIKCLKVAVEYMGWKNFKIFPIAIYESVTKPKKNPYLDNSRKIKKFGFFSLAIFYLELHIRYFKLIISNKNIIIFDRFFYDRLIRAKNNFLYKLFYCLTPKVNLIFYLTASPEILYQRKPEISIINIKQVQDAFERKKNDINYISIDTSKYSQEEIAKRVTEKIFKCLPNEISKVKSCKIS